MGIRTMTVYHGGFHRDPRWFTTDPEHAGVFGDVRAYRLRLQTTLEIDMTHTALRDEGGYELDGYEADAALYRLLEDADVDAVIVDGWEGEGLCILIADHVEPEGV